MKAMTTEAGRIVFDDNTPCYIKLNFISKVPRMEFTVNADANVMRIVFPYGDFDLDGFMENLCQIEPYVKNGSITFSAVYSIAGNGRFRICFDEKEKKWVYESAVYTFASERKPMLDHSARMELMGCLADIVEDFLEEKGFSPSDFPNDDRQGDDGEAILYGCDYDRITGLFEETLIASGLLSPERENQ